MKCMKINYKITTNLSNNLILEHTKSHCFLQHCCVDHYDFTCVLILILFISTSYNPQWLFWKTYYNLILYLFTLPIPYLVNDYDHALFYYVSPGPPVNYIIIFYCFCFLLSSNQTAFCSTSYPLFPLFLLTSPNIFVNYFLVFFIFIFRCI